MQREATRATHQATRHVRRRRSHFEGSREVASRGRRVARYIRLRPPAEAPTTMLTYGLSSRHRAEALHPGRAAVRRFFCAEPVKISVAFTCTKELKSPHSRARVMDPRTRGRSERRSIRWRRRKACARAHRLVIADPPGTAREVKSRALGGIRATKSGERSSRRRRAARFPRSGFPAKRRR